MGGRALDVFPAPTSLQNATFLKVISFNPTKTTVILQIVKRSCEGQIEMSRSWLIILIENRALYHNIIVH